MRNTLRLLGIIALGVIIGFSMISCDNGTTSSTPPGPDTDIVPTKDNYTINLGGANGIYQPGATVTVIITPKTAGFPEATNIRFTNSAGVSTATPTAAGTYSVTFDVPAATGYKAVPGLFAGNITINGPPNPDKRTPVLDDYEINGKDAVYNGQPRPIQITRKDNTSNGPNGLITIFYEGPDYPKVPSAPINVGVYAVTFTVAATDTWNASAGELDAGQLTITDPPPVGAPKWQVSNFDIFGTGVFDYKGNIFYSVRIICTEGNLRPTIKIYYDDSDSVTGVSTPGPHNVTFDVEAAGGFDSAYGLFAGTITITQGNVITQNDVSKYFDISGLSQVYAVGPTSREVKITPKYGYAFLNDISKTYLGIDGTKYGPSSTPPSAIGTYNVTFTVKGNNGFMDATLQAGTLTIDRQIGSPGTLKDSDFVVSEERNFYFNVLKPVVISVNPVEAKKDYVGVVTVRYQKDTDLGVNVTPVNVGRYFVYYDVSPSVDYSGLSDVLAGSLTINEADLESVKRYEVVGDREFTYNGSPKWLDIVLPELGIAVPQADIYYNGRKELPQDAGPYKVTFDLVYGALNWKGQSQIDAGELIIHKGDPLRSNFTDPALNDNGKEYDGLEADVTVPVQESNIGLVSPGDRKLIYVNKATGVKVTSGAPINAGTYALYLYVGDDDNWNATSDDGLFLPGFELTINKREAKQADFRLVVSSALGTLDQYAYSVKDVRFERVPIGPGRIIEFPHAAVINAQYFASSTSTTNIPIAQVNAREAQTYKARITLTEQMAGGANGNWLPGRVEWDLVISPLNFDTVARFVTWYNGLRALPTTIYKASFRPGVVSDTGLATITDTIKLTAEDIDDEGLPVMEGGTNVGKLLNLDLSGALAASVTTLVGAFDGCENLRGLDISGAAATFTAAHIDATTFRGLSGLTTLKLAATPTAFTASVYPLAVLTALTTLDTGGLTALVPADLAGVPLQNLTTSAVASYGATTSVFENHSTLRTLTITGNDLSVPANAFKDAKQLAEVTFPPAYTGTIGANAFDGCTALNTINFPTTSWLTTGSIGAEAFKGIRLTNLRIEKFPADGIDASAFGGIDSQIRTITLGGTLHDTAAFQGMKLLETVTLLNDVLSIPDGALPTAAAGGMFRGCTRLSTVNFPPATTAFATIGNNTFKGCTGLNTNLPSTLTGATGIGESAFENCTSITRITIPEGVTTISASAFKGSGLSGTLTLPANVIAVNDSAFENCTALTRVILGLDGTTEEPTLADLGNTAGSSFAGCRNLATFGVAATTNGVCDIPEVLVTVLPNSFKDCKFTKVKINTVAATSVPGEAFSVTTAGTGTITTLEVSGDPVTLGLKFGAGNDAVPSITKIIWDVNAMAATVNTFAGTGVTTLEVKKALASAILGTFPANKPTTLELTTASQVADAALFADTVLASVTTVKIGTDENGAAINLGEPSGGTLSAASLFNAAVKNITFLGPVGTLGPKFIVGLTGTSRTNGMNYRFEGNTGNIPNAGADATEDNFAFADTTINTVFLGAGVTSIGNDNFVSPWLTAINVDPANRNYGNFGGDGVLYGKSAGILRTLVAYPAAKQLDDPKHYTIQQDVQTIGTSAFRSNTDIEILTIPAGIRTIGAGAFTGMNGLRTVNYYATNVSATGGAAFPLTVEVVNIGNEVQVIPANFLGANTGIGLAGGLNEAGVITIPASVTMIGPGAFNTATAIKEVRFNPTDLLTSATGAFSEVVSISRLVVGPGVKVIPANTFNGTSIVTGIDLSSVVTIGAEAFADCIALTDIEIPASCVSIGDQAFGTTDTVTPGPGCAVLNKVGIRGGSTEFEITAFPQKATYGDDIFDLYDGGAQPGLYTKETNLANPAQYGWIFRPGL